MGAVKDQFDMQTVVDQQDRIRRLGVAAVASEFCGVHQGQIVDQQGAVRDVVAAHVGMAGAGDGKRLVQEHPGAGDDPCAVATVIAARRRFAQGVGAVKCVVKAAPARIGGVQHIAGIGDRHDQLRAGDRGDLGVDIGGVDLEIPAFGQQIPDLAQKLGITAVIHRLGPPGPVPLVDPALQLFALVQQGAVARAEVVDQPGKPGPEAVHRNACAGQGPLFQKVGKDLIDLQTGARDTSGHPFLRNDGTLAP